MTHPNAPHQADAGLEQGRQRHGDGTPPGVAELPPKAPDAHLTEDADHGVRVDHQVKPAGPLPPEQASQAGQQLTCETENGPAPPQAEPPLQDVRVSPEEPSVWVAAGKAKD